jgi:hypothetical protein
MMAGTRDIRLTITPFTYILMVYLEEREEPADFLQKTGNVAGRQHSSQLLPRRFTPAMTV